MPLFDRDNPVSEELAVAVHLSELMAAADQWQALAETTNFNACLEKITIGGADEPADGVEFNVDELANELITARIFRVEGTHVVTPGGFDRPNEQGDLQVLIRRHTRESEQENDAYLDFWDRTSRLVRDLQLAIETLTCPRILSISEPQGPWRNSYQVVRAQGKYCWTLLQVKWGDPIEE